jgi:hypothetical protein
MMSLTLWGGVEITRSDGNKLLFGLRKRDEKVFRGESFQCLWKMRLGERDEMEIDGRRESTFEPSASTP